MSDARLDALSETARNRGLKLVRSRVRTPGKGDYGKVGLTDAKGAPVFGFKGKALAATPAEAEDYLRNLGASDWGASLDVPVAPRKKPKPKTEPEAVTRPPPRKPAIRAATGADAEALVPIIGLLGHKVDEKGVRKRIGILQETLLVATLDDKVVGLCGLQISTMIQRDKPVGRITILVVAEDARGVSLGRMLVETAEARFRKAGCGLIEVTSRDEHVKAHAFYRHMGYERTSLRFAKDL